jgi:protein-tyrosine phosphatase
VTYVDLHCHLLPGLDDGARTLEETVRHARRMEDEGVLDVACTPHVKRAHFPRIDLAELAGRRALAQRAIAREGLELRLHAGGELAHDDALTLDDRELELIAQGPAHAPFHLLEVPFEGLDDSFDEAVERLRTLGYGLLLAHPERADGELTRLRPHLESGALLQVNVSSLTGEHGPRARAIAERLIHQGVVYCLASDGHPGTRDTLLSRGPQVLERLGVSEIQAYRLTASNPRFLLREGDPRLAFSISTEQAL